MAKNISIFSGFLLCSGDLPKGTQVFSLLIAPKIFLHFHHPKKNPTTLLGDKSNIFNLAVTVTNFPCRGSGTAALWPGMNGSWFLSDHLFEGRIPEKERERGLKAL